MSSSAAKETIFKMVGIFAGLAVVFSYRYLVPKHGITPGKAAAQPVLPAGVATIMSAFSGAKSGVQVQSSATVKEVLEPSPGVKQQKLVLTLDNGHTLLLSHDTEVAPPIPAKVGDRLEFRGQYEWNDQGGLIHWTHHDPEMKHEDGWVKLDGKAYR